MIGLFLKYKSLIGIGLAVLGIVGWFLYTKHLHNRIDVLKVKMGEAVMVARDNASALETIRTETAKYKKAVEENHKIELERLRKSSSTYMEIARAPITTNCVNSPAIATALRRLRE